MARLAALVLAAVLPFALAACGVDCEAYCDKMDECNGDNVDCDSTQCVEFCEQALDTGDSVGFSDSASCALDSSCNDLRKGACFPWGLSGTSWCAP